MSTSQCRDINKLNPDAKLACQYLLEAAKKEGLNIIVTETLRTTERQQYLYAQGRTRPGNIVTNCDGVKNKSIHQYGNAFDICQNIKGKEYDEKVLKRCGVLGEKIGLEWGGRWTSPVDQPHFQLNKGVKPVNINQPAKPKYTVTKTKLKLNGVIKEVHTINIDNYNHVKLRDLADKKITIGYENKKVLINGKVYTGAAILFEDTNYVKLRDLPKDQFVVDFVDGIPTVTSK